MCRCQWVTGKQAKYLLSGFSFADHAKFVVFTLLLGRWELGNLQSVLKKTRGVLFSSSVNRLIRNFLVIVAVLFGIRALMFTNSNPLWDFAQPDDLTSKKKFFSYLEGYEPGFLHADFVSSSNGKKPQQLERGATLRQRYQWYTLWS